MYVAGSSEHHDKSYGNSRCCLAFRQRQFDSLTLCLRMKCCFTMAKSLKTLKTLKTLTALWSCSLSGLTRGG